MNDTLTETSLKIINCYIYTTNLQLQKVLAWLMNIRDLTMLYVKQADHLRQETLEQMSRILTIRQAARCLLALGEYFQRLRALSSLWSNRPREPA